MLFRLELDFLRSTVSKGVFVAELTRKDYEARVGALDRSGHLGFAMLPALLVRS